MSSGIDAMMGMGSLWRHRMSNTSSRNPSMVAIRRESSEERYTASFQRHTHVNVERARVGHQPTHLMMGKLVDDKAFASPARRVIVGSD